MTEEERLRAEAAKRLERRRRKMQSPEERLAKITGQPVSSISLSDASLSSSTLEASPMQEPALFSDNLLANIMTSQVNPELSREISETSEKAPDPPLENLVRTNLSGISSSEPVNDLIVPCSNAVWVFQALVSFLLLQFGYGSFILNSVFTLFLLMLVTLVLSRRISLTSSTGSILSAVLVLCGLRPNVVQFFIRSVEILLSVSRCFALYITSFIIIRELYLLST